MDREVWVTADAYLSGKVRDKLTAAQAAAALDPRYQRNVGGAGTKEDPLPSEDAATSDYEMYLDERDGLKVIVCVVGNTTLLYDARAIDDLHELLISRADWVELGSADEQKAAKEGTVEAWARSRENPLGGWYGLRRGCGDASACICRPCWNSSGSPRSSTTHEAIECGAASRQESPAREPRQGSNTGSAADYDGAVRRHERAATRIGSS